MSGAVLVIATGGTIVSVSNGGRAYPDIIKTGDILAKAEHYFERHGIKCQLCRIFGDAGCDSSDIGPEQWLLITERINAAIESRIQGILILHGTDTMAYTAAWLSLCFEGINIPIVLTGSQRTSDSDDFDGVSNLLGAAELVSNLNSGVWLFFDSKVYYGNKVHKSDASALDAFSGKTVSLRTSEKLLGDVDVSGSPRPPCMSGFLSAIKLEGSPYICSDIAFCRIVPGLPFFLSGKESIVIVEGYGAGNVPKYVHRIIENTYSSAGKPLIIACSQAECGHKDPLAYRGVGIGELSSKGFSVFNQGDYPIEFILALCHFAVLTSNNDQETIIERHLSRVRILN